MNSKDIEECIKILQEYVDTKSIQWISEFRDNIKYNETFSVIDNNTLYRIETLRQKHIGQFNDIEQRIESMEKLCDELEDIHDEIEVKFR